MFNNSYIKRPIIANRKIRLYCLLLFVAWLTSFIVVEFFIVINAKSDVHQKVDYLIILGSGLRGEQVSPTLKERLDKGSEYLKEYPELKVIVSGGRGFRENITEAEAMRRYLVTKGIANDRIIKEERSTSTMENFKNTKQLFLKDTENQKITVMIVTNGFHMLRSKMLAERNGFEAYGIASRTSYRAILATYLREYFALIKSYFFDR